MNVPFTLPALFEILKYRNKPLSFALDSYLLWVCQSSLFCVGIALHSFFRLSGELLNQIFKIWNNRLKFQLRCERTLFFLTRLFDIHQFNLKRSFIISRLIQIILWWHDNYCQELVKIQLKRIYFVLVFIPRLFACCVCINKIHISANYNLFKLSERVSVSLTLRWDYYR